MNAQDSGREKAEKKGWLRLRWLVHQHVRSFSYAKLFHEKEIFWGDRLLMLPSTAIRCSSVAARMYVLYK